MVSLGMSFENMIQNRRNGLRGVGNSVRGVGRGRRMRGVGGQAGTFRGDGLLAGPPPRGPLGMYGPGGRFRGAERSNGRPCLGPLVMYGLGGTCRGAGRLAGRPRRGPLVMDGPVGTCRGAGQLVGHPHRGSMRTYTGAKTMRRTRNLPQQNNVFRGRFKSVGSSGVESGSKLQVSNLSDGVSNEDIRGLFSELGELVHYGIHYDKNGNPCGSAEVVFARRSDAFEAVKRYNNTQFHEKPMKIIHLGSLVRAHVASGLNVIGGANGRRSVLKSPSNERACGGRTGHVHGGRGGRGRGHGIRGGRGRVHGGWGERPDEKSAEELENCQAETTQAEEQDTQV